MKFVIIALVLAVASAVPEHAFVQESSMISDTETRRSACVKAADASINNVFKDVQNSQRMLNRMNNGRHCATRNQHLINRAQRTIHPRVRQVHAANAYLRTQRRSRVRWNYSFESLRE